MIRDVFSLVDNLLSKDLELSVDCQSSEISIDNFVASVLRFLIRIYNPSNIIELGTLYGRSAILMSEFAQNCIIHSIEKDLRNYEIAKENIAKHNLTNKVKLYFGDCLDILNTQEFFGMKANMMFVDANKLAYGKYLDWAINNLEKDWIAIFDNVFIHYVLDKYKNPESKMYITMEAFIERISDKKLFDTLLIPYKRDCVAIVKSK